MAEPRIGKLPAFVAALALSAACLPCALSLAQLGRATALLSRAQAFRAQAGQGGILHGEGGSALASRNASRDAGPPRAVGAGLLSLRGILSGPGIALSSMEARAGTGSLSANVDPASLRGLLEALAAPGAPPLSSLSLRPAAAGGLSLELRFADAPR